MDFSLVHSIELLKRAPEIYSSMYSGLSPEWYELRERKDSWNGKDILAHLIQGETQDWIPRARLILSSIERPTFEPFDHSQRDYFLGEKSMEQLLTEFKNLRYENINSLLNLNITVENLSKEATHPDLGIVTLQNLLATWTLHDQLHINQASRIMAKAYSSHMGPWRKYSGLLNK